MSLMKPKQDEHPIEDTLRETAAMLALDIPPRLPYMTTNEGWLLQAQILREIAKRLISLENKA